MTTTTPEQLNEACDDLVQGERIRVDVNGVMQWATMPSLLDQLATAEFAVNGNDQEQTSHDKPHSKPTINAGVVALLIDIPRVCRLQIRDMNWVVVRSGTSGLLRDATYATALTGEGVELDAWREQLENWRKTARRELRLDVSRRQWIRGVKCPRCEETTARQADSDGVTVTPALAMTWTEPDQNSHVNDEWQFARIECRACNASWLRADLRDLLIELLAVGESVSLSALNGDRMSVV